MPSLPLLYLYLLYFYLQGSASQGCSKCGYSSICVQNKCKFIALGVYYESDKDDDELIKFCTFKNETCKGSAKNKSDRCLSTYGSFYCKCGHEVGQQCEYAKYSGSADEYASGVYVYFPIKVPLGHLKSIYISMLNTGKNVEIILKVRETDKTYRKSEEDMINLNVAEICKENSKKHPAIYDSNACDFLSNRITKTLVVNENHIPELSELGNPNSKGRMETEEAIGTYKILEVEIRNGNIKTFNDYFRMFMVASPITRECYPRFSLNTGNTNNHNEVEVLSCEGLKFNINYQPQETVDIPCDTPSCTPEKFRCDSLSRNVFLKVLKGKSVILKKKLDIQKLDAVELPKKRFHSGLFEVIVRFHFKGRYEAWSTTENFYNEKKFWARVKQCPLHISIEEGTEVELNCKKRMLLNVRIKESFIGDPPEYFQYVWSCDRNEDICKPHTSYTPSYNIPKLKCDKNYEFKVQVKGDDGIYYGERVITVYSFLNIKLAIKCKENCGSRIDPRELLRLEAVGSVLRGNDVKWEIWNGPTKEEFSNLSKEKSILEIKTDWMPLGTDIMIKASAGGVNATFTIKTPQKPHKGTVTVSPQRGYFRKTKFTFHFEGFRTYLGESLLYELKEKDNESSPGKTLIASRSKTIDNVKLSRKIIGATASNNYGLISEEVIIKLKLIDPDLDPDNYDTRSPKEVSEFLNLITEGLLDDAPPAGIANFLENVNSKVLSSSLEIAGIAVKTVNALINMAGLSADEKRVAGTTAGSFLLKVMDGASKLNCSKNELEETSGKIAETLGHAFDALINAPKTDEEELEDDEQSSKEERLSANLITGLNKFLSTIGKGFKVGEEMKIEKKKVQLMVKTDHSDKLMGKEYKLDQGAVKFSLGISEEEEVLILQSTKYSINPLHWAEINQSTDLITVDMSSIEGKKKENVPVQLTLEVKEESSPRIRGTVRLVSEHSSEHEKDLHVELHKFIPKEGDPGWGVIRVQFVKISSPIKVAALIDHIPDYEYIQIHGKEINETFKEFDVDASSSIYGAIFYIGIITEKAQEVAYSFRMTNAQCLSWAYMNWADTQCTVNLNPEGTLLNCNCSHMSSFSGKLFTPPNLINPITDIRLFKFILQNPYILIFVLTMACIILMLLIWARIKDRAESKMKTAYLLEDSIHSGECSYVLGVYTGSYLFAGTTANVCIQVHGSGGKSDVHLLKLSDVHVLQVGQDDWFIFYTPSSLGVISRITLFHDDSLPSPDWYCRKIIIYDINNDDVYTFEIGQWISILTLDASYQLMLEVSNRRSSVLGPLQDKRDMVTTNVVIGMRNAHNWLSIFLRHPRAVFTRCQLIMSATCVLSIAMIVSMMFFGVMEGNPEDLPKVQVTLSNIIMSIEAFIISFPVAFIVLYFFDKARKSEPTTADAERESQKRTESSQEKIGLMQWLLRYIKQELSSNVASFPLLPVTIGQYEPMRLKEKIWVGVAWTFAVVVTLTNCFFMVFYSLKFGKNKSLQWLYSFTVGWVQDLFFMEPFKIIVISIILGFFLQRVASVDSYHFKIIDIRKSETPVVRKKPVEADIYKPLTKEIVQERLYIRQRADFMKWLYVRLLPTIVLFCLTFFLAWRSGIDGIHFEVKHAQHHLECPHDSKGVCLQEIHSRSSFLNFLKTIQSKHCSMSSYLENHDPDYCNSFGSKLIGVPRLRQQRVRPSPLF